MALDFIVDTTEAQRCVGYTEKMLAKKSLIPDKLTYPKGILEGRAPTIYAYTAHGVKNPTQILSSIIRAGKDTSARYGNFLAHYLVLEDREMERCKAGPAWLLQRHHFFTQWTARETQTYCQTDLQEPNYLPIPDMPTWRTLFPLTWEEELKKLSLVDGKPTQGRLLFDPTHNYLNDESPSKTLLRLFFEFFSQLPEQDRWKITFSTFATSTHHNEIKWHWMGLDVNDKTSQSYFAKSHPLTITIPPVIQ